MTKIAWHADVIGHRIKVKNKDTKQSNRRNNENSKSKGQDYQMK